MAVFSSLPSQGNGNLADTAEALCPQSFNDGVASSYSLCRRLVVKTKFILEQKITAVEVDHACADFI